MIDMPAAIRAWLVEAIERAWPEPAPVVAYLPGDLDEATLVDAAARRGVALYGLAPYRISHAGRPGLIFGYATLDERAIEDGVAVLAAAAAEARQRH